jgi:DNA-binding winged helix-turn-helix (wHTH) protein
MTAPPPKRKPQRPDSISPGAPARRSTAVYRFGPCEVRVGSREVCVAGVAQRLEPRPFDALVYLIEHRERIVTLAELMQHVWPDAAVQPGTVVAALSQARKALCDDRNAQYIRTCFRVGYRFVAPLNE